MFCEILHDFLIKKHSNDYKISDNLCVAIDTFNVQKVVYEEMLKEKSQFSFKKFWKKSKI
jgi:hypothetical protein